VFATVGVHPHEASGWSAATSEQLLRAATHPKVVAIGEMGLDFHYDFSPRAVQETAFRAQLRLAQQIGLPVILHNREADEATLRILEETGADCPNGVCHCFTSDLAVARRCLDLGFCLGFTGIVTFKTSGSLREILRVVPTDRVLVETDCPYLAPEPFRGKRNEPAHLAHVVRALAEAVELPCDEVVRATTENSRRVFTRLAGLSEKSL
jgi:TatD DNase family protein